MEKLLKTMRNLKRSIKFRKYNNLLDVLQVSLVIKKVFGLTVFELTKDSEKGVVSKFSPFGLLIFTIHLTLYYFSTYKIFSEDQTILRELYNTRLKHYGDVFERIMSSLLVSYVFWKLPFHTGLSIGYVKKLFDIDAHIESLGAKFDYSSIARRISLSSVLQVSAGLTRLLSVWITLSYLQMPMPVEVIIQATFTNVLALAISTHYCYYVNLLHKRYEMINKVLAEIKDRKSWEQTVLVRSRQTVAMPKVLQYQDKYICEKIKACAKIYGLLFKAVEASQDMYGFALACTLLFCLLYVILYLFYFMEATAAGLFHDTQRYLYFLIYVFWQIIYAVSVIFLNVHFSDACVTEARRTSYVVHEIINSDISTPITTEAMQFSLQMLHQVPVFTACGLCTVDYTLFLQGAYNVATFLVILLQFVMD